jgi:hypothetical protein
MDADFWHGRSIIMQHCSCCMVWDLKRKLNNAIITQPFSTDSSSSRTIFCMQSHGIPNKIFKHFFLTIHYCLFWYYLVHLWLYFRCSKQINATRRTLFSHLLFWTLHSGTQTKCQSENKQCCYINTNSNASTTCILVKEISCQFIGFFASFTTTHHCVQRQQTLLSCNSKRLYTVFLV